jgi:hypothetical protein
MNVKEIYRSSLNWLERKSSFRLYAVVLLGTMALAYDSQVWRMGFYYDDWEGVFLYKQGFSFKQIWDYFLIDRPFSSFVHVLFNPILGASSIGWHILGLLLNWGAILFLVRALLQLWPKRIMEVGWLGLLLALYPGISRQFVILTSIPHYSSMFLYTLSLLLMIRAVQSKGRYRIFLYWSSVAMALMQVLIVEYFSALELIRLMLLFYIFRLSNKDKSELIKRVFITWLPYALVFILFLVYKFEVLPSIQLAGFAAKHQLQIFEQLVHDPFGTLRHYSEIALQDVDYAVFYVWTLPGTPQEISLESKATLASWGLGAIVAVLCAICMWGWFRNKGQGELQEPPPLFITLLSVVALILGGLPNWIIDRQAINGIWAGRFLFGQVLGAVPLIVLITLWLTGQSRRQVQNIFFAILLASSFSLQFRTGNKFVLNWRDQRNYYWQMKWRVPSMEPGTFILSPYTPIAYNAKYQIAYAVNIIYAPHYDKENVLYWWFDGPSELWDLSAGKYRLGGSVDVSFRSIIFKSDFQHALPVIYRQGRGCLQVVDEVYKGEPLLSEQETQLFTVINHGLVDLKDTPMPVDVFGKEPPHDWCYFFEKADLAREFGQWDEVIRLWEAANAGHVAQAKFGPEYLPFIEAFARQGDWEQAVQLTAIADKTTQDMQALLCDNWKRILEDSPASQEQQSAWQGIQNELGCVIADQ